MPAIEMQLSAEAGKQPEEEREQNAEQNRGSERKENREVLAAPGHVARHTAQRNAQSAKKIDETSRHNEEQTKFEEQARDRGH